MTRGIPQGSVLGTQIFTAFINNLDDEPHIKFADDTKIGGTVISADGSNKLQR